MEFSPYFSRLPSEIIRIILEYDASVRYRRGKYMNQLRLDDPCYDMLRTVRRPRDTQIGDRFHREVQFTQGNRLIFSAMCAPTVDGTLNMYMYYPLDDASPHGLYIRR
jgi:hypothetical protein